MPLAVLSAMDYKLNPALMLTGGALQGDKPMQGSLPF